MQMRTLLSSFTSSVFSLLIASPQGRRGDPGPQGIDGARVSHIGWNIFLSLCLT